MKRVGRQRGLTSGIFWGVAGALICAAAMWQQSFWLLCFGTLVWGVYNAYGQYYRFAAADVASARLQGDRDLAGARRRAGRRHPRPDHQPLHHRPARPEVHGRLPGADRLRARHDGAAALHPHSRPRPPPSRRRSGRPLRRDRRAAALHRRGALRRARLRRDELPHDLDADRDGRLRPSLRRRGVRHLLARRRHVRAVVLHRRADQALRRADR